MQRRSSCQACQVIRHVNHPKLRGFPFSAPLPAHPTNQQQKPRGNRNHRSYSQVTGCTLAGEREARGERRM
ncbi:predicted protein [Plenodomus lingam JN3]|uniref:Predicted protein n=1 Tax=Leptosphaeria maculans (strain JN3 / isolate v23.1.3 / race Av1-4-5-6-7-8) TaxID=985895 RepID=E5A2N3_LEPMJ|nr:predicted protein [Plenodomus lingam JN3]CBX97829.1 predicted protein [Plenodomus lingam JN3]